MSDIVQFLKARLDEDQAAAEAAHLEKPAPWRCDDSDVYDANGSELIGSVHYGGAIVPPYVDEHIARHDPSRALREVAAKRRILDRVVPAMEEQAETINGEWGDGIFPDHEARDLLLHALASPYSDHPDYDPAWSVDRG